jgi:hypothetical protein
MRFTIRLLRYRGRILPWREVINRPALSGDLRVEESFDEELRRYLRTARLVDETSVLPIPGRPELRDARLVAMSPLAFTLAGFERVEGADYAQSWIVTK